MLSSSYLSDWDDRAWPFFIHADRTINVVFHPGKLTALVPVWQVFNVHCASETERCACHHGKMQEKNVR